MMTLDTAAQFALYTVLIFGIIFAIITVVLLGALVFGLVQLNTKIDSALEQAKPLIVKSTDILDTVQRVTMNVGERADTILAESEEMTAKLARKVDHTASVVEKTVTSPLIGLSSVLAGVSKGFEAFNRAASAGSKNGTNGNGTKQ